MSIKFENTVVTGWESAIRGMRNPMNSWAKSDSWYGCTNGDYGHTEARTCGEKCTGDCEFCIGPNDLDLMRRLRKGGPDDRKFMRMIAVYVDITAPTFWWQEFDTYKVGTVRNSCSKMHKIHVKPFTINDFTHEGIDAVSDDHPAVKKKFLAYIDMCEWLRKMFNDTQEKRFWRALIEALPEGFNMRATIMSNYEVITNQYRARVAHPHKLNEWRVGFGDWVHSLPHSELITGEATE